MKGKYNTGVPINIKDLTEEERKEAFHEWAEGSKALEKLLNQGYESGFLSKACCGGDTGKPYICYDLNDENTRKMAMSIAGRLINSDLDCSVTIYDNFLLNDMDPKKYPTRDIIQLNIGTSMDSREEVFNAMVEHIRTAQLENIKLPTEESKIPHKELKKTSFIDKLQQERYSAAEVAMTDSKNISNKNVIKNSQSKEI